MELTTGRIRTSLLIIGLVFFFLGFITWVNAMLIPFFKKTCELTNFQSYLVTFAFYISYLVIALPASFLLKHTGFKKGMAIGFFIMAAGAFVFLPAAGLRSYILFLTGLFIIGIGLAILQTAVNPYITILGAKERAAQRISIMGIANKTAGIIAPLLLATFILKSNDTQLLAALPTMSPETKNNTLNMLTRRLITPYAIVGCVLALLGLIIRYSRLPEPELAPAASQPRSGQASSADPRQPSSAGPALQHSVSKSILRYPHLVLGAIAIFFHVGSQIIAVDSIINYAQSKGMSLVEAKALPSYTLTATICGYLGGITLIPKIITQLTALRICTILGIFLSILVVTMHGMVSWLGHTTDISVWLLASLGLANSLIWAGIWPLALDGLGSKLKAGASLLIMGLSGNAILPLLYGHLADARGLQEAYIILLPCYIYLSFYAFYGYKIKHSAE